MTLKETPSQEKQQMWANIINSVNDIWPSIQVIFEKKDLIKVASEAIHKFKEELGKKPKETTEIYTGEDTLSLHDALPISTSLTLLMIFGHLSKLSSSRKI